MTRIIKFLTATIALAAFATCLEAQTPILSPGDAIIAIDTDVTSISDYPGAESPDKALDNDAGTKYLNFGKDGTGLIFTPAAGSSTIQSMQLTTANDWPARDPNSWELYGTNDAIMSADNGDGNGESWMLISSGPAMLPGGAGDCDPGAGRPCLPEDARTTAGPVYTFSNSDAFSSYKVVFPTIKDSGISNSMQVAGVDVFSSNDGSGMSINAAGDPALALGRLDFQSNYPAGESPTEGIDGDFLTKYLNFGGSNSGFIVTPSGGASVVDAFQMWTANDAAERDPADWQLYGTNEPIQSADNSDGTSEDWTLLDTGTLGLPDDRNTMAGDMFSSGLVAVNNTDAYTSYKFIATSLKGTDDIMQFSEVQLYNVPEPSTLLSLLVAGGALLAVVRQGRT